MNKTLFLGTLKANYMIVLGFVFFCLIYVTISVGTYKPDSNEMIEALLTMLPDQMVSAFGFDKLGKDLTSYLSGYLFGFILIVFPVIYSVIIANNLVAKLVDKGSMAYLLTSTNTRLKVIITQFVYMTLSLLFLFGVTFTVAVLMAVIIFPGNLDIMAYLQLNMVTFSGVFVTASIAFLFSCLFNESRIATAASSGMAGLFIVTHMVAGLGESTEFLKYLSVFTLVDVDKSINDGGYALLTSLVLILIGLIIGSLGTIIFNKRSLTI